jgi:RNAse (barnase) inhibitor barstar
MNPTTRSPFRERAHKALYAIPAIFGILMLTGCTTPTPEDEPYFDKLTSTALASAGFTQEGSPLSSCGGNTPFCVSPVFTVQYKTNDLTSPQQACAKFTETVFAISNPSLYSSTGYTAGPLPLLAPEIILNDFCSQGIGTAMLDFENTPFYQGTTVIDIGLSDQITKQFSISREADGTYRVTVDFSRNLDTFWTTIGDETPAHLTLEQIQKYNENTKEQVKVQEFANSLIGVSEKDALEAIAEEGYLGVVFQRDEREHSVSGSNPKRIMLNVQDGKVSDAVTG